MLKRAMIVATILVAVLLVAAWALAEDDSMWVAENPCPFHQQTAGIPIPDRDNLDHCECEKWWRGQAPARLVFADCSHRTCAEHGPSSATPLVYVDLPLYRCPKCGLLFTEPDE